MNITGEPPVAEDVVDRILSSSRQKFNLPRNAPEIPLIREIFINSLYQSAVRVKRYIDSRQGTPQPETPSPAENEDHAADALNISSQDQPAVPFNVPDQAQGPDTHGTANVDHSNDWWFEDNDDEDFHSDEEDEDDEDEDLETYFANTNNDSHTPSSSSAVSSTAIDNGNGSKPTPIDAADDTHSSDQEADHAEPPSPIKVETISDVNKNQDTHQEESGHASIDMHLDALSNNHCKLLGYKEPPSKVLGSLLFDDGSDDNEDKESCKAHSDQGNGDASPSAAAKNNKDSNEKFGNANNLDASCSTQTPDHGPRSPSPATAKKHASLAALSESGRKSSLDALTAAAKGKKRSAASLEDDEDKDGSGRDSDLPSGSKPRKKTCCNGTLVTSLDHVAQNPAVNTANAANAANAANTQEEVALPKPPIPIDKENFFATKSMIGKRKREFDEQEEQEESKPRKILKTKRVL
ncbi:hypothetical protein BD408DRAFT_447299 [Parasitella parasitica]|nr:hypothetical protein BD408DRAFT_447299 [Parasitella parasitica]